MNIWHVENRHHRRIDLWRLESGIYQVIQAGAYLAVLTKENYSLIDVKYTAPFLLISTEVTMRPAVIYDRLLKTDNHNYLELDILNRLEVDDDFHIKGLSAGHRIWQYHGSIFVSSELKRELEAIDSYKELEFSEGFSTFAC